MTTQLRPHPSLITNFQAGTTEYHPSQRLPEPARRIYRTLQDEADALHSAVLRFSDQRNDLVREKVSAQNRINHLRGKYRLTDDATEVTDSLALIKQIDGELADVSDAYNLRAERMALVRGLVDDIDRWLRGLPNSVALTLHTSEVSGLRPGESPAAAVERLREQASQLRADIRATRSAPISSAEAKRLAREQVRQLAEKGRPSTLPTIELGEAVRWPTVRIEGEAVKDRSQVWSQTIDPVATLAWLFPEEMTAALHRDIDELADDEAALSDQERADRIKALQAKLLETERQEAAAILASGGAATWRRDLDPRAALGLSSDLPPVREFY